MKPLALVVLLFFAGCSSRELSGAQLLRTLDDATVTNAAGAIALSRRHTILASCTPHGAVWTSQGLEQTDDFKDFAPIGNDEIWECRVGNQRLELKSSLALKGQGYCGGCYWGEVTILLNGLKLIDAEDAGELEAFEGRDRDGPVLTRFEWGSGSGDYKACRSFGRELGDEWGRTCVRVKVPIPGPSGQGSANRLN